MVKSIKAGGSKATKSLVHAKKIRLEYDPRLILI